MPDRIAYLPLDTHPEAVADAAIQAAIGFAADLGSRIHASVFSVRIPPVASPIGGQLINIDGMVREAEEKSRAEAKRLTGLVGAAAGVSKGTAVTREVNLGGTLAAASVEARHFDLTVLPWEAAPRSTHDLAEAMVFESGRPVVLVPATAQRRRIDHIAIAWDDSRVAARALADALPLLTEGGRITVLTVHDEKALRGANLASDLAKALGQRGYAAEAKDVALKGRPIHAALQDAATEAGAALLAMGGFGHSRWRDFVLGGATKGVLADLRLPVLLSH